MNKKLKSVIAAVALAAAVLMVASALRNTRPKPAAPAVELTEEVETAAEATPQPEETPEPELVPAVETASAPDYKGYTLKQMVILSRHNIRSPLSGGGSALSQMTDHQWFEWSSAPSELSLRGGVLETMMGQYFRKYAVSKKLLKENAIPEPGVVRFYANSMQRTIATAQYFSSGFLPVANMEIESHYALNTMDEVFEPKLTLADEAFCQQAMEEISAMGGEAGVQGIQEKLEENYRLLEEVLDFPDSEYARTKGISQLPTDDLTIHLEEGKEPYMTGSLKMANAAVDGLKLQYYEEPDDAKAAFGKALSWEQWLTLAQIGDVYQETLFTAPSVAVNVAHPLLIELERELNTPERKFSFLCGHDSNVASVLKALDVEDYDLPAAISRKTPIGVKLVLETWADKAGGEYVSLSLVYQSVEQLRSCALLDLDHPPMKYTLRLKGLYSNDNGLYLLEDVLERFDEAIAAYDALPRDEELAPAA